PPPLPLLQPQGVLLLVLCVAFGQRILAGGCSHLPRGGTRGAHTGRRSMGYRVPERNEASSSGRAADQPRSAAVEVRSGLLLTSIAAGSRSFTSSLWVTRSTWGNRPWSLVRASSIRSRRSRSSAPSTSSRTSRPSSPALSAMTRLTATRSDRLARSFSEPEKRD